MFRSMSLAILGLIFIIAITVVYFSKKKYNDLKNSIYRFLLLVTILLLVMEIVCVYTMSIRHKIPVLNEILCRMDILFMTTWLLTLIGYVESVINEDKYPTMFELFETKKMLAYLLITSIIYYISCFLDITYTSGGYGGKELFYVIGGDATTLLYVPSTIVAIYLMRLLFHNFDKENAIKRIPVIITIVLFFFLSVFRMLVIDINDITFLFALCAIAMYFTLESQDMRIVSELDIAKKEAELADKSKTQFLTKISHEIRTPMNVIMGYSEMAMSKKKLDEKEVRADVKNIYNAGKTLLEIINNILTYSRIESGKEKVEENEYSLSDIIGELESFVYAKIDPAKIKFSIILDGDIPSNYVGDKLKIYRVLLNVINNAIKYTDQGEVTLIIKCSVLTEHIAQLHFEIKDTGIGMKKSNLDNIFNELNKVTDNNSDIGGLGLGLVLTKKLINMLDGSIVCESEYGIGTTFNITINQKTVGETKIKDLDHLKDKIKSKSDAYFDCSKYKVLIVDDNKLNRMVIERLLKPYKVKYESLDSSSECINKIKSGEKYDLILLDHMMPEIDGIETLRILKKLSIKDLPPVIAVTANIVTELKETYIKEGFSDYLSKPVDIKELQKLMNKYFKEDKR